MGHHRQGVTKASLSALLRAWRERSLLSQEELAARAGLGVRTVRRLETGSTRRPHGHSTRMLADALKLTGVERAQLAAAVYGQKAYGETPTAPVGCRELRPVTRPGAFVDEAVESISS